MRNRKGNRGNFGSTRLNVERVQQQRFYDPYDDSDIYEDEFEHDEIIYDGDEHHFGRNSVREDDEFIGENDLDQQYRNVIDREEYEHQRSMGYISNNPKRLRKPSKRRFITDAERDKRIRNHYIMQNLGVTAKR
jgi:hypothetical protein